VRARQADSVGGQRQRERERERETDRAMSVGRSVVGWWRADVMTSGRLIRLTADKQGYTGGRVV